MTSPERWQRLEELFHAALELAPGERPAFVANACGDDDELRRELERLLVAAEDETPLQDVVSAAVEAAGETADASVGGYRPGETLGAYRLSRVIGRGGLGTVYLAERADDQYRMQVALKIVRRGMTTPDLLARLRQERQILASLDHPSIARLLDGGTTRDGLPYVVMEYIEGQDLETYCDHRRLGVAERLELFRRLCDAVDYAHRNLVVHRDIKPSNILVTETGVPKLLDFGIAKLLDPEPGTEVAAPTLTGQQLLTPHYASPEQVRGETLTTATDVYSLGVVLYRLLAGRHPYRLESLRPAELERTICETEPLRPSAAVVQAEGGGSEEPASAAEIARRRGTTPEKLARRLAGDLDTIVGKALRKEPERRYASAGQLGEDLRRHLEGLPVSARPDTAHYRARKFLRRHRVAVAAAAAVAVLVVSLVVFYTAQLARERDLARLEAAKAEEAFGLLIDVFEVSDPSRSKGETVTARELLDRGAERLRQELTEQPEVRATMLGVVGGVYRKLGLDRPARELLEESLEIRRRHFGERSVEAAESANELAELLFETGDLDRAEELLRHALELRLELLGADHPDTVVSRHNLAALHYARGDLETAEELFRQVLAARRRAPKPRESEIASTINNLAVVLDTAGDLEGAEALYREALEIKRRLHGPLHLDTAASLDNLAGLLEARGDDEAARALYEEALEIHRRLVGDASPDVTHGLERLAVIARRQGDAATAERLLREAIATPTAVANDSRRGSLLGVLGLLLLDQGRAAEAEPLLRRSLELAEAARPAGHWRRAQAEGRLGACLVARGRAAEGEELIERGLETMEESLGADDRRVAELRELAERVRTNAQAAAARRAASAASSRASRS